MSEEFLNLVVGMGCIVEMDPTLRTIADLPPGWGAYRKRVGEEWVSYEDKEF